MSVKVTLESGAAQAAKDMIDILKSENPGLSITTSDLTSWIVSEFKRSHFDKAKQAIVDAHFNPKAYLRARMKGARTNEEISSIMEEIQRRIHPKTARKKTETQNT